MWQCGNVSTSKGRLQGALVARLPPCNNQKDPGVVIGIQSSAWPDALQTRLDIKGPETLSLIASTSVGSAGTRRMGRMGRLMSHSMAVITTSPLLYTRLTIISVSFPPAAKGLVKIKARTGQYRPVDQYYYHNKYPE